MEKSICKACNQEFKSDNALHKHVKAHNLTVAEYYTTYYPRKNKLTGDLLPYKNKSDYFNTDFSTREQMIEWCNTSNNKEEIKEYILNQLRIRVEKNKSKYCPNHIEIEINKLPPIDIYKRNFGGYGQACQRLGIEPMYNKGINRNLLLQNEKVKETVIHIDTREQKPLFFLNSKDNKLDFGDYTIGGKDYTYTYVDRKSEGDFKGTMSVGFQRFRKELERAKQFNAYLYIVTESSIDKIIKNNKYGSYSSNLSYVWHNMRILTHEFKGHCQFVFSGSRPNSQLLIPNLLYYGKNLWDVDIQYLLDNY
tara:strand:+ start:4600 stop:5523 length:924 start_codon:yes stop_codon:yes gene_type:complete